MSWFELAIAIAVGIFAGNLATRGFDYLTYRFKSASAPRRYVMLGRRMRRWIGGIVGGRNVR